MAVLPERSIRTKTKQKKKEKRKKKTNKVNKEL